MGSRSDPERAEVRSIIEQVFSDRFSGRAGQPRIFGVVWPLLSVGLREYLARKGLKSEIGLYLREQRPEDGLPQAPQVNSDGEHAQFELWTLDECRFLIAGYMSRSLANRRQAQKVAARAQVLYDVAIDVDDPFDEASAS